MRKIKFKKMLSFILTICLLVGGLSLYLARVYAAEETVVYVDGVNGLDTNDGFTDLTPVKTMKKAYSLIQGKETATIAVIGEVTLAEEDLDYQGVVQNVECYVFPAHTGEVVITSKVGNKEYENGALNFGAKAFSLSGDTTFENIAVSNNAEIIFACYHKLTLGKGVKKTSGSSITRYPAKYIYMGIGSSTIQAGYTVGDVYFTMDSGSIANLYGGNKSYRLDDAANYDVNLEINGGSINVLYGTSFGAPSNRSHHKNVNVTVNGGTVNNLYGAHGGTTVSGNVKISLNQAAKINTKISATPVYSGTEYIADITGATILNLVSAESEWDMPSNFSGFSALELTNGALTNDSTATVKISLKADTASEGTITINKGVTLDLNGYTLNMDDNYLLSNGDVVDNSTDKTGRLKVGTYTENEVEGVAEGTPKALLAENNTQMPVYISSESAYMLASMKGQYDVSKTEDSFTVISRPSFGAAYAEKLANGADAAGLQFIIRLNWTDNDTSYYQNLKYVDDLVKTVYAEAKAFSATVNGLSEYKDSMKVTVLVKSDIGVEWENNSFYMSTSNE